MWMINRFETHFLFSNDTIGFFLDNSLQVKYFFDNFTYGIDHNIHDDLYEEQEIKRDYCCL